MIRVLQITDNMTMGGIQSFIMNVYRHIDRTKVQFDFLLHHKFKFAFDDEIISLGGKIYYLPARNDGFVKNKKALAAFFKEHRDYQIVHMHESSLSYIEPLMAAKRCGINQRIFHAHSTSIPKSLLHRMMHMWHKHSISKIATHYFACGEQALKWMYGGTEAESKATIVLNGVDLHRFLYNEQKRKTLRGNLGLSENCIVLGHVGRFNEVKNHNFLIEIMLEVSKLYPESRLILLGGGPLVGDIKAKVKMLGIEDLVLFLGIKQNVADYYQVMDVLVLPSFYEGFPVTLVEAQASGLPAILSNTISQEVAVNSNIIFLSLDISAREWANVVVEIANKRLDNVDVLLESQFDINNTVKQLMSVYIGVE